jgi:HAD superfamily hydrolase (TIGR01509 family)
MNDLSAKVKELYEDGYDVSPKERGKMLLHALKLRVPASEADKIYEKAGKLFSNSGFVSKLPNVNPEAEPALRALKSRFPKIKIGLISNAARSASTYRRILNEFGIASYFDELIISCEIGYLKPRREIFEHALAALSVQPEETVHVGDLFQADVIGAASCRMNACLYTGLWHKYAQYTNTGEHIARDFRPAREGAIVQEIERLQDVVGVAEKIP